MTSGNGRVADHPIAPIFLERWSPRALAGETMPDEELFRLFEAARWAPSASNLQPWRFLYAKRDTLDWRLFFELLSPGNMGWAADASALLVLVSKRTKPVKDSDATAPNPSHSFDAGAAWACLALQASAMGWSAHAIGGFDVARAVADLGVPDDYRVECMIAVGRAASPPRIATRAAQINFVREGRFPG